MSKMKYELQLKNLYEQLLEKSITSWTEFVNQFKDMRNIVIYGGGFQGRSLKKVLDHLQLKVEYFWDLRADELGAIDNVPVYHSFKEPDNCFTKDLNIVVAIFDMEERNSIIDRLKNIGYVNIVEFCGKHYYGELLSYCLIYDCYEKRRIGQLSLDERECLRCAAMLQCNVYLAEKYQLIAENDPIIARGYSEYPMLSHTSRLRTGITHTCNLKCRGCYYSLPHMRFEHKGVVDLDKYLRDIKRYLSITECVSTLVIGFGETLQYQDELLFVLRILVKEHKILRIMLVTNGTIPLKQELIEFLVEHPNIYFLVDDYKLVNMNIANFFDVLDKNDIVYQTIELEDNIWHDFRTVGYRHVPYLERPSLLNVCKFGREHGILLRDGVLTARCGLQKMLMDAMQISDKTIPEWIDIWQTPIEQIADRLLDFHNGRLFYYACLYCPLRDDSVILPTAEQMSREEFEEMRRKYEGERSENA